MEIHINFIWTFIIDVYIEFCNMLIYLLVPGPIPLDPHRDFMQIPGPDTQNRPKMGPGPNGP